MAVVLENGLLELMLTKFTNARVETIEDVDGNYVEGVFIPLKDNNLKVAKNNHVYAYAYIMESHFPHKYGWTHYLKMKVSKEFTKTLAKRGYEVPFIGHAKNYVCTFNPPKKNRLYFIKANEYGL